MVEGEGADEIEEGDDDSEDESEEGGDDDSEDESERNVYNHQLVCAGGARGSLCASSERGLSPDNKSTHKRDMIDLFYILTPIFNASVSNDETDTLTDTCTP